MLDKFKDKLKNNIAKYALVVGLSSASLTNVMAQNNQLDPLLFAPRGGTLAANVLRGRDMNNPEDRKFIGGYAIDMTVNLALFLVGGERVRVGKLAGNVTEELLIKEGFVEISKLDQVLNKTGPKVYEIVDLENLTRYGGKTVREFTERFAEHELRFKFGNKVFVRIKEFETEAKALKYESELIEKISGKLFKEPMAGKIKTVTNYQHNVAKDKYAEEVCKVLTDKAKKNTARKKHLPKK